MFPALKSPAAFHEQRKSLERSKVRAKCQYLSEAKVNMTPWHVPYLPGGTYVLFGK